MKKLTSIILLFVGFTAWGQDCSSPSSVTHYKVEKIAKKRKQLEDPEFLNGLKADLIRQIQQTVTVADKSMTTVINGKEKKSYSSKVDITATGLIINPTVDICVDMVTVSIEKEYMHELARKYLTQVIKADNKSIETILKNNNSLQKTYIKNQLQTYNIKKANYEALIPLALQSKKDFSIDQFSEFKVLLKQLEMSVNNYARYASTSQYRSKSTTAKNTYQKPKSGYYKEKVQYTEKSNGYDKIGWVNVYGQASAGIAFDNDNWGGKYNTALTSYGYGIDVGKVIVLGLQHMQSTTYNEYEGVEGLLPETFDSFYYTAGLGLAGAHLYYKESLSGIEEGDTTWTSSGLGLKYNHTTGMKNNNYKGLGIGGFLEVMTYKNNSQYVTDYASVNLGVSLSFIF